MAFQVSPGVQIREFDLTAIVPAVSTTPAGYVGVFQWGPADQRVLINTEKQLESIFFKPLKDPYYATSWLLASNFLAYGGNLQIVRSVKEDTTVDLMSGNDANALSYRAYPTSTPGDIYPNPETNYEPDYDPTPLVYAGPRVGCVFASGVNANLQIPSNHPKYTAPIQIVTNYDSLLELGYDTFLSEFFPTIDSVSGLADADCSSDGCCGTNSIPIQYFSPLASILRKDPNDSLNFVSIIPEDNMNLYLDCNCAGTLDNFDFILPKFSEDLISCSRDSEYCEANPGDCTVTGVNLTRLPALDDGAWDDTIVFNLDLGYNQAFISNIKIKTFIDNITSEMQSAALEYAVNNDDSLIISVLKKGMATSANTAYLNSHLTRIKSYITSNLFWLNISVELFFGYAGAGWAEFIEDLRSMLAEAIKQKRNVINGVSFVPGDYDPNVSVKLIKNRNDFEDQILQSSLSESTFYAKYPGVYLNDVGIVIYSYGFTGTYVPYISTNNTITDGSYPTWAKNAFNVFNDIPTTTDQAQDLGFIGDEIHVAIVDVNGSITGTAGQVLEYFEGMSVASDAKKPDGTLNFWKDVINNKSQYVWVATDVDLVFSNSPTLAPWGTQMANYQGIKQFNTLHGSDPTAGSSVLYLTGGKLAGSMGQFNPSNAALSSRILTQYETSFGDPEESDVSMLIGYDTTIASDVNDFIQISENRKDCIAFVSAGYNKNLIGGPRQDIVDAITDFSDSLNSTSYGVLDSGYKYQYDRFNNVYRYVPLCADIAGCMVRTDNQRDPWFSPAGYDRGRILNVVKLTFNPNQAERDVLYKKNINPVIASQGFGVILFGDKTLQKKASAFDRINVRRLFNVVEKSIATAAKFSLFEFNDEFTRTQFKQLIEPFLRDVQGRRGITGYAVVCDESNNTPTIVDSNRFVADIFIAPNRSINFIQLNFVATPTGVTFAEYGG